MANGNYSVLKDNIDDYIKQNGDGDITGQVLQTQLFAMITSLGAGYQFMGVAKLTPTPTDPGSPDQNVFYVAFQPGIYSNFGSQTVADGEIAILKWNGSWTKEVTGAASAAKLDELGQKVGVLGAEVDGVNISFDNSILTDGAFIDATNGAEVTNSYSSRTDYLPVYPGETLEFAYRTGANSGYALYNKNKQYISGGTHSSGQRQEISLIVPDGVYYIRVSYYASNSAQFPDFYFRGNLIGVSEYVDAVKKGTAQITKTINYTDLTADKYYRGNGTTLQNASSLNGTYCILIPVDEGDVFRVRGIGPTAVVPLIIVCDSEKVITRTITGNYRDSAYVLTIGSWESYIAVNFYNYDSSVDKLIQEETYTTNQLYEAIKELEEVGPGGTRNWFWKSKNVVVFGDSISEFKSSLSGGYGWTDRFVELSESNVFNGAIGGSRISARRATILPVSESETTLENSYRAYNSLDVVNLVKAWVSNDWSVVDTNVAWLANNVSDDNTEQINHLKSIPVADADVVIISAGTNDWHNGSADGADTLDNFNVQQIYGALNNIVKDILSANTKIRLYFLTPIPRYVTNGVPAFSTSEDYAVGDLVMYNNVGYVFTSAHAAGAWDSSQVRAATALDYRRDECSSDVVQVDGRTLLTFAENEISFIHRYHLPIADMYKNIGFNKYNWSNYFPDNDNTHPHKGYVYLGERIYTIISSL